MQSEKSKAARSQRKKLQDDGAQNEDHLEVFDKLTLNLQDNQSADMQRNTLDLKTWAINCADEIKTEIKQRAFLRNQNREGLLQKIIRTQSGSDSMAGMSQTNKQETIDDVELMRRRSDYWGYLRTGVQFIALQNRVLERVLLLREEEIAAKAEEYASEKAKTREMYKYLAILEKPVEEKLEEVLKYNKVIQLREEQKKILHEQLEAAREQRDRAEQMDKDEELPHKTHTHT